MTILVAVLILGFLVFMHELGHFAAAKRAGVYVHELAFGMGPRVLSTRRGETTYSIRALPFGGFVRMASVADPVEEDAPPVDPARAFESQRMLARIGVIAAGPVTNFLLAILLIFVVFGLVGIDQPLTNSTLIGNVVAGGPAATAGIKAGDRVTSVDGKAVGDWQSMVAVIQQALGREVTVTYERDGQPVSVTLIPTPHPQNSTVGYLGIAAATVRVRLPLGKAFTSSLSETWRMLGLWIAAFSGLFRGQGVPDVTGPVGIIQMLGEASQFGLANLFFLAAVISANFGLINLFPIPALDGSRLVFFLIEALRGKPVPPEQEGKVHMIGYGLMMALLAVLTYRDLVRIIGGNP